MRACTFLAASCIALAPAAFATTPAPAISGQMALQVGGTVQSVDAAARTVTVLTAKGGTSVMQISPDVQNLAQLKTGTQVTGTSVRPVTMTALADGAHVSPAPGQVLLVAQVVKTDAKTGIVTLKDSEGTPFAVQVSEPGRIADIRAGMRMAVDVASRGIAAAPSAAR
jgi:hypothetical protein